jgi:archaellum biogenesis protein FlaJ (TadC family)
MIELYYSYASILPLVGATSAVIFVISLLSLPWLAAKIPEDYFLHSQRQPAPWQANTGPIFRLLLMIVKNLLGLVLLAGGFLMLFIPGQGLLTIFMGLVLIDYPKKFAFEKKLVSIPAVLKGLNWLRKKAHQPPLKIDG